MNRSELDDDITLDPLAKAAADAEAAAAAHWLNELLELERELDEEGPGAHADADDC